MVKVLWDRKATDNYTANFTQFNQHFIAYYNESIH